MTTMTAVESFLAQERLAVVGVSAAGKGFGAIAYKELKKKGFPVVPIHPKADVIEGDKAYPSLAALPEPPGGVLLVVQPSETEKVVEQAIEVGVKHIWMQQGAESAAAIQRCNEAGVSAVAGECILMFARPVGFPHGLHRWVWRILGKLPKEETAG